MNYWKSLIIFFFCFFFKINFFEFITCNLRSSVHFFVIFVCFCRTFLKCFCVFNVFRQLSKFRMYVFTAPLIYFVVLQVSAKSTCKGGEYFLSDMWCFFTSKIFLFFKTSSKVEELDDMWRDLFRLPLPISDLLVQS